MLTSNLQANGWFIIINPNAGRGLGKKDWKKIESFLKDSKLHYTVNFTSARGHAIQLTHEGILKGYRNILAVGGDGTMNEIVNGCFIQNICLTTNLCLGMITLGTGNDWGRMFNIPNDYQEAIHIIKDKKTCLHDTGVVEFYNGDQVEKRYFINIAGLGFDAMVVKRTNWHKEKGHSNRMLYFWNLLRSLLSYNYSQIDIVIDGKRYNNKVFTMSLGIGRYSGGGMIQTPNALHDDGLFDVTVINKMRKTEVIRNLKLLYNGQILSHPKVNGYTGRNIVIDSNPLIHLEVDGELLGHTPVEFKILPRSIRVVHNRMPAN